MFGRHPKYFIIFDLYRVIAKFAKVHSDIARFFKSIRPLLPKWAWGTPDYFLMGWSHKRPCLNAASTNSEKNASVIILKVRTDCNNPSVRIVNSKTLRSGFHDKLYKASLTSAVR